MNNSLTVGAGTCDKDCSGGLFFYKKHILVQNSFESEVSYEDNICEGHCKKDHRGQESGCPAGDTGPAIPGSHVPAGQSGGTDPGRDQ